MTDDPDRIEALLRRALRNPPPPQPTPGLCVAIVERVRAWEHVRQRPPDRSRRWILAGYWTAAALASVGIIAAIPWRDWTPLALSESSAWLFAVACAATLTPAEILRRIVRVFR